MANFKPQEISLGSINGGVRYANGDIVDAEAINAPIEASAYAQEEARNARAESSEALAKVNDSAHGSVSLSAYPVGSIYMSTASVSPASLFGGTWESIQGRFLLGADGASYLSGATGGEANVTLTIDTMPAHGHDSIEASGQALYWTQNPSTSGWSKAAISPNTGSATDSENNKFYATWTGGGEAHNNMPPYLAVYMWKRVS